MTADAAGTNLSLPEGSSPPAKRGAKDVDMGLRTYQATGVFLRALERVLKLSLQVSGEENLVDRPTLFVCNHFTRFETMLIPYAIYRSVKKPVRCLADHVLFQGALGKYLRACGNISTREPLRNRTIIGDLLTGRHDWVIYPEGVMVKNKRIVENGRLRLDNPLRQGPPHTGAALLALRAEITRRLYNKAVAKGDRQAVQSIQERYHFTAAEGDPVQVKAPEGKASGGGYEGTSGDGAVVVPVTITYYPLRPDENLFLRLAKLMRSDISDRLDEELRVEGKMLLGDTDMGIHFGQPIEVNDFLDRPTDWLRRMAGLFSPKWRSDLLLKPQAARLTRHAVGAIYRNTEVNFDHLFCYGLRALKRDVVAIDDLRRALYLAAMTLRNEPGLRLHPHLRQGLTGLLAHQPNSGGFEPFESVVALAKRCEVIYETDGQFRIARHMMRGEYDFHEVRLRNTIDVIANEIEPVEPVVSVVRRCVKLPGRKLRERVHEAVHRADRDRFHRDYQLSCSTDSCRSAEVGEPFFLEAPRAQTGVVLVHGYLSAPEQMRPLAQHLHAAGYSVYGVSLKGHGTVPTALTSVSWHEWVESIIRGCVAMREHCPRVVVGGFSLGGVLALYLAATQRGLVDAVISINSPMRLRDWRVATVGAVVTWNKLVRSLGLPLEAYGEISNNDSENPDINYPVHYPRGLRQLRLAMKACRKRLGDVAIPALVIQADADPLVHPTSGQMIYDQLGSREKLMVEMAFDRHVIVRDEGCEKVFEKVTSFLNRLETRFESPAIARQHNYPQDLDTFRRAP